jgi:hypothetical protein
LAFLVNVLVEDNAMADEAGDDDVKRQWVERVLNIKLSDPTDGGEDGSDALRPTEFASRIKDLILQGSVLAEPYRTEIIAKGSAVNEVLKSGDLDATESEIEDLEDALTRAAGEARVAEALKGVKGLVQYRKLQISWRDAQTSANAELARFIAAVLADPEVQEDELYPDVVEATAAASTLVPGFGGDLSDVLDKLDATTDAEVRNDLTAEAKKLIGEYSSMLDDAEGLRELQSLSDDEYGGISFFGELQKALRSLETAIP